MPNDEQGSRALPEPPSVNNMIVLRVVGGFLLFVAVSIAGLLFFLRAEAPGALVPRNESRFPEPMLQTAPQHDLARFEEAQRKALSGYAWVDRDHNLARIPVEEAMRMIAARGDHAYDPLQATSTSRADAAGGKP